MAERGSYGAGGGEDAVEREMREVFQRLHQEGVIDLDKPARQMIEVVERAFAAEDDFEPAADAYYIVGSRGAIHHIDGGEEVVTRGV